MSLNHYYDRQGNAIEGTSDDDILFKWAGLFEDERYRRVASTYLPDGTHVSTIWLGTDHGFHFMEDPTVAPVPIIFETMTFRPLIEDEIKDNQSNEHRILREAVREDVDQWRYTTEAEAIIGHWAAAAAWMKELSAADQERFVKDLSEEDKKRYEEAISHEATSSGTRSDACENGHVD